MRVCAQVLATKPYLHAVDSNTTSDAETVLCIQPSWPNASGVSCLTATSAISCPYPDEYRGNQSLVEAEGQPYYNLTTSMCYGWPLEVVYDSLVQRGLLYHTAPDATLVEPWLLPCDKHVAVAVGQHSYCVIDEARNLRCNGNDELGQSATIWPPTYLQPALTLEQVEVQAANDANAAEGLLASRPLPEAPEYLSACAGEEHTCAVERSRVGNTSVFEDHVACWGANYSTLDVRAINAQLAAAAGALSSVTCGKRFVCALAAEEYSTFDTEQIFVGYATKYRPYCTGSTEDREGVAVAIDWAASRMAYSTWQAGEVHACGLTASAAVSGRLSCFGNNGPLMPLFVIDGTTLYDALAVGGRSTCVTKADGAVSCFAGSLTGGARDTEWLVNLLSLHAHTTRRTASIADSVACVADEVGSVTCGGEPGQQLYLLQPPAGLQSERLDLVERGVAFSSLQCGGTALRNGSQVELGQQFCCGIEHHTVTRCWGILPPHNASEAKLANDANLTVAPRNLSVAHAYSRPCVTRQRYMRDLGLRLLLDTHPNVSLADAATNHTQPYLCHNVPRRWSANVSRELVTWLGANISNVTDPSQVKSWQLSMALALHVAAYTAGLSCFNFTQPLSPLYCNALLPFVNRTVELVTEEPKSFSVSKMTSTDLFTTTTSLTHTLRVDGYCFEKLRLTPSEQFRRGAAWHRSRQRVVDGFEVIFSFQLDNGARMCKTVRALVTGTLLYERCQLTPSDGIAFVIRADGAPSALGRGGGSLGYGGLKQALAIELDTWSNPEMGELPASHVSVQASGPAAELGAHREQTLATTMLSPLFYPQGLADGQAHVVRVVYTPGLDAQLLRQGPPPDPNHLRWWVHEGEVSAATYPHERGVGTWARPGTGTLQVSHVTRVV